MEALFRRLEAWGYPAPAIDWLRKRRLLVIVILALLSWTVLAVLAIGIYSAGGFVTTTLNSAGPGELTVTD